MKQKILCIEDDPTMQMMISTSLKDYTVVMVSNLADAEKQLPQLDYDAVLLDILLPDGDGLKFWARMSSNSQIAQKPVLFLTGQSEISNKLLAFSVGAEDFISKPFDPLELQARVNRRLKARTQSQTESMIRRLSNIEIDLSRQRATLFADASEKNLQLTSIELKLLWLFSKRLDQVYSREQILQSCWGDAHVSDRTVDSHIAHLRSKMTGSALEIQTVKNFGYRLSKKEA